MITYANENIVNWLTTLADSFRVGVDIGLLRFCLKTFHKPLFLFKGSFVVTKVSCERAISFDNGLEGSITEDVYFALLATSKGVSFDWIEGEMWEKSPFSIWDFLQQRKRWLQGIFLVVHDKKLPLACKFWCGLALYSWISGPLNSLNFLIFTMFPLPTGFIFNSLSCFVGSVNIYLYIIGAVKSFKVGRMGVLKTCLCVLASICTIPFVIFIENIAIVWGLLGDKTKFYVVKKFHS